MPPLASVWCLSPPIAEKGVAMIAPMLGDAANWRLRSGKPTDSPFKDSRIRRRREEQRDWQRTAAKYRRSTWAITV